MINLSVVIDSVGLSKQQFAEATQIPYYRIATILYNQDGLTSDEEKKIISVFGNDIFLIATTQNV